MRSTNVLISGTALAFVIVINLLLEPSNEAMGLAAVATFALLTCVSFFDVPWPTLIFANASCVIAFVAVTAACGRLFSGATLVVVCTGAVLAVALGALRGTPGHVEFVAQRRAERLLLKCQQLLSLMLPTKSYVDRLMHGETVVEVSC